MKLDSNLAFKEAASAVAANKEVLLALAGVFFVLPSLAFAIFFPQPEPQPGMQPEQLMTMLREYYLSAFPYALPMAIVQMAGSLAVLTLFTDRSRPTVGEAIKQGFIGLLPYFGASLLMGLGYGLVGGVLIVLIRATGSTGLAVVAVIALLISVIYMALRLSLLAPVVAVDRVRNPVAAIQRSWALTKGNAGGIALFFLLLIIVFIVVSVMALAIAGVVFALVLGTGAAKIAAAALSSLAGAAFTLYFMSILAAVHRQLAGPSSEAISATFD